MKIQTLILLLLGVLSLPGCATMAPQEQPPLVDYEALPLPPSRTDNGSIYQAGYSAALFEDVRAHTVGDILTVVLTEETKASKTASTSVSKENTTDVQNPTLFGKALSLGSITDKKLPSLEQQLSSSKDFSGSGKSDQSNKLSGSIQVIVIEELPNRYLRIAGEKTLTINQGDERVRLTGIVRPQDIRVDNSIPSTRVANAMITYSGSGMVADANDMGWLARFFNSKWFPF